MPAGDERLRRLPEPAAAPDPAVRPHVCFVAPQAWPVLAGDRTLGVVGGAEVQQGVLARALAGAGYRVSMICLDYGQPQGSVVDGVTVYKTHRPAAGIPVLRFVHPRLTRVWQAMRAVDADIYYQRSAAMLTAVVAAFCRRHGKRSIYAGASDPDFMPGRQAIRLRRDRWLFERGLAMVDRIVVQNATQRALCQANYGRDPVLIPSCYELPADAHPEGGDDILWVGVMRPSKRPGLFLELARRLPELRFVMIGGPEEGSEGQRLYETIRQAAATLPNLRCTGFLPLDEVERRFDRAGLLVNTSTHEGMPNTFLQAWARGVPTVAFIDAEARWEGRPVYPVVDSLDAAVHEVRRLHGEALYRRQVAARCRAWFAQRHGVPGVLARYRALFDTLMREPAP